MLNVKNQRGSIAIFVLSSCIFFIASVTCIQMYMKNKSVAVDREYRQIKLSYEQGIDDTTLAQKYSQMSNLQDNTINVLSQKIVRDKLIVQFALSNTDIEVKEIKYGWGVNTDVNSVEKWTYIEKQNISSTMMAMREESVQGTTYYLHVMIDGKDINKDILVPVSAE